MPLDKDQLFANQREVLKGHSKAIDPTFLSDYSQRVPIDAEQGKGFLDFHWFDNVLLGRADCTFFNCSTLANNPRHFNYGIQMMLSGELSVSLEATQQQICAKAPEIWLSKGDFGSSTVSIPPNQRMRNLLVEFSADFIESLGQEAAADSLCKQLINADSPSFIRLPTPSAETIKMMWQIYEYAGAVTHLDLLAIQGATFSLMSHLLNTSTVPKTQSSQAREGAKRAQIVLDNRYAENWKIRTLARAVGINEFDLKREFKVLTGSTINHYLRSQRMRVAMNLLQNGEDNLTEIADSIGYSHKDYFVRVFRTYYGFHPKDII